MSHTRRRVLATALAAAFAATTTVMPAQADTCAASVNCNTTVTFTVSAGAGLQITVPNGPLSIGTGSPGAAISGQLGSVTVSDQRASVTATWVAQVSATDFTTGGGTAAETIANSRINYWSGPATATTGTGTFVPGQANAASSVVLDQTRIAFSKTTGAGNNSATWNPTIVVDVPAQAVAGTYTGVIRHSVA
ncbi:hypothetical protein HTZ77_31990 [Nonomuraea sp. SMC257]|uniref:WxL domain-containing protein n=1 Tax=Nonomuraea montanisoli TaxID=2741721 RepID=A0A7Y6IDC2_9ACTN|nr:hypothetical protein [Nonomuraea montanisoli]NUW36006.1 hypothetical protein [Nonomuraea montanisoli]